MMMQLFAIFLLRALVGEVLCQTELTSTEKQDILDLHNTLRGSVTPTASNMETMVWSDELAQVAQNYANTCNFDHNSDRTTQQTTFSYVGENLAAGSGTANYNQFVQNWHDEVTDYNYATNSCGGGKVCGHYTQVVWAQSNSLGCGARRCVQLEGISGGGANWVILVCNYGPGGNYRGQKPYVSGTSCSACPSSSPDCSNNICTAMASSAAASNAEVTDTSNAEVTDTNAETTTTGTDDRGTSGITTGSGGDTATLNVFLLLATSFIAICCSITSM